jgi:hypothetical protein
MTTLLAWITAANAALFFFGAMQHAGVAVGPFHEPRILPAAVVETACGLALMYAAVALFQRRVTAHRVAVISNLVALAGVVLGMISLAMGAGPRTASNDLYHRLMLAAIAASFLLLFVGRARRSSPL